MHLQIPYKVYKKTSKMLSRLLGKNYKHKSPIIFIALRNKSTTYKKSTSCKQTLQSVFNESRTNRLILFSVYVNLSLVLICPSNCPSFTLHPNIYVAIYLKFLFITEYIKTFHQELQVGRMKTINSTIKSIVSVGTSPKSDSCHKKVFLELLNIPD